MHLFSEKILNELTYALKRFGEYPFDDKGPGEVMDISYIAALLRSQTPQQAGDILAEVSKANAHDGRSETVANDIAYYLQDWDELFDHPEVECFYG